MKKLFVPLVLLFVATLGCSLLTPSPKAVLLANGFAFLDKKCTAGPCQRFIHEEMNTVAVVYDDGVFSISPSFLYGSDDEKAQVNLMLKVLDQAFGHAVPQWVAKHAAAALDGEAQSGKLDSGVRLLMESTEKDSGFSLVVIVKPASKPAQPASLKTS